MKPTDVLTKLSGTTFYKVKIGNCYYYTNLLQNAGGSVTLYDDVNSFIYNLKSVAGVMTHGVKGIDAFLPFYKKIIFYNKKKEFEFVISFCLGSSNLEDLFSFVNEDGSVFVNYKKRIYKGNDWEILKSFWGF